MSLPINGCLFASLPPSQLGRDGVSHKFFKSCYLSIDLAPIRVMAIIIIMMMMAASIHQVLLMSQAPCWNLGKVQLSFLITL